MGHLDASGLAHTLPDGRVLFSGVSFRVGEGAKVALVGPNGAGKTTLLRMISGDLPVAQGTIARSGGLGVMRQFIGMIADETTLSDLALSLASPPVREAGRRLAAAERALAAITGEGASADAEPQPGAATPSPAAVERAQMHYAVALTAWGEAGGYDAEVLFDIASVSALGLPWERARTRLVRTLSGGEQKRFALELLLRGPYEVLLLDEPDNFLDVPGKLWLEARLRDCDKSVLYVSHDRELLAQTATRVVALEGGTAWTHAGGFSSWPAARQARYDRLDELRRRWDEEHQKLRDLVAMCKQKAAYNDRMASRLQAAQTRLRKFEEAGPPQLRPKEQNIRVRLTGGRTGKRAVICEQLELEDLTFPFDLEIWYGDRVAVLGGNGTGKSHFLRLLARGGSDPDLEHQPVGGPPLAPVAHAGVARLGARVRPGHFSQTHDRPDLVGRTLVEILWHGDDYRDGLPRPEAMKALNRYELAGQGDQRFETLSGGQQARFQVLLLELSGATLLLLDEPTDNLDLASAEALERGLQEFAGTVIAVTHDRWFARSFDRYVHFSASGEVTETAEPVWVRDPAIVGLGK